MRNNQFKLRRSDRHTVKFTVPDTAAVARHLGSKPRGGYYTGPCPICGGDDRFWLRKDGKKFGCRHCANDNDTNRTLFILLTKIVERMGK